MLKNNKGFSLIILVITILVIVIISSTAIITIKSITKDRGLSHFMSDLAEVKQFVVEYVGRENSLPIKVEKDAENNVISAEKTLLQTLGSGEALDQIFEEDTGDYYFIDINKLGKIHLSDENRGYIMNEGTLNIYVIHPLEYKGTKYYTLTPFLTGKESSANTLVPFEITVMGNPITWTNQAEILVTVPNVAIGEADGWNFRWLQGSHSIDDFKSTDVIHYFTYGETISFTENGIYTIYVENPEGRGNVRKVVVTKIDDIAPTITLKDGSLVIDDAETGVKSIRYKIKETENFPISTEAREKYPEYYTQSKETLDDTEEDLLDKYLWGSENIKGNKIDNYLDEYQEYYEKYITYYNVVLNEDSESGEVANAQEALKVINRDYPQFAYGNRAFPNTEKNIVLYVEDMAGNGAVYSAINRDELTTLQYLANGVESLSDAKVLINNGDLYTNHTNLSLTLQALLGKFYFVTEERVNTPNWKSFTNNAITFEISPGDGEKIVYAFFKDANGKIASSYDTILLDQTPPSDDKPSVMGDVEYLTITPNQKDTRVVNRKETQSGLSGAFRIGVKKSSEDEYAWYTKSRFIPVLEKGVSYDIVTEVTDRAGNPKISQPTTFFEEE